MGEFSLETTPSGSHAVEEEVFQVVVQGTLARAKSLQGGGTSAFLALTRIDGKFVDFQQETWKQFLCACHSNFKLMKFQEPLCTSQFSSASEGPRTLGSSKGPSVLHANLNIDTILLDVSASLAHSVAIASKAWLEREIPQAAIFQHYIIFNNTLEDIYFGQTGTDQVIMMQVRGCCGYSWKRIHSNHNQVSMNLRTILFCKKLDVDYCGAVELIKDYIERVFSWVAALSSLWKALTKDWIVAHSCMPSPFDVAHRVCVLSHIY